MYTINGVLDYGTYGAYGAYGAYGTYGTYGTYGAYGTYVTYGTVSGRDWACRAEIMQESGRNGAGNGLDGSRNP